VFHNFSATLIKPFILQVKVVCETRDIEHANMLKKMLYENYKRVIFGEIPSPNLLGAENLVAAGHV
jgi:threonine dehydratase